MASKNSNPFTNPSNSNPFGGNPRESTASNSNPFGAHPSEARASNSNPFGANPFGAKPSESTTSLSNPFGANASESETSNSNPFGAHSSESEEEEGNVYLSSSNAEIEMEGYLTKKNTKGWFWSRRYFVLDPKMMTVNYYKDDAKTILKGAILLKPSIKPKSRSHLYGRSSSIVSIGESNPKKNQFYFTIGKRSVMATSAEERERWVEAIKDALDKAEDEEECGQQEEQQQLQPRTSSFKVERVTHDDEEDEEKKAMLKKEEEEKLRLQRELEEKEEKLRLQREQEEEKEKAGLIKEEERGKAVRQEEENEVEKKKRDEEEKEKARREAEEKEKARLAEIARREEEEKEKERLAEIARREAEEKEKKRIQEIVNATEDERLSFSGQLEMALVTTKSSSPLDTQSWRKYFCCVHRGTMLFFNSDREMRSFQRKNEIEFEPGEKKNDLGKKSIMDKWIDDACFVFELSNCDIKWQSRSAVCRDLTFRVKKGGYNRIQLRFLNRNDAESWVDALLTVQESEAVNGAIATAVQENIKVKHKYECEWLSQFSKMSPLERQETLQIYFNENFNAMMINGDASTLSDTLRYSAMSMCDAQIRLFYLCQCMHSDDKKRNEEVASAFLDFCEQYCSFLYTNLSRLIIGNEGTNLDDSALKALFLLIGCFNTLMRDYGPSPMSKFPTEVLEQRAAKHREKALNLFVEERSQVLEYYGENVKRLINLCAVGFRSAIYDIASDQIDSEFYLFGEHNRSYTQAPKELLTVVVDVIVRASDGVGGGEDAMHLRLNVLRNALAALVDHQEQVNKSLQSMEDSNVSFLVAASNDCVAWIGQIKRLILASDLSEEYSSVAQSFNDAGQSTGVQRETQTRYPSLQRKGSKIGMSNPFGAAALSSNSNPFGSKAPAPSSNSNPFGSKAPAPSSNLNPFGSKAAVPPSNSNPFGSKAPAPPSN
eukprot:g6497.t1